MVKDESIKTKAEHKILAEVGENEEVKNFPREEQIKTAFPCGWRPSKLCKGYCDEFNITEKDLV